MKKPALSKDLLKARKARKQNQREAAAKLGITQAYFCMIESGKREPKQPEILTKLKRYISFSRVNKGK